MFLFESLIKKKKIGLYRDKIQNYVRLNGGRYQSGYYVRDKGLKGS